MLWHKTGANDFFYLEPWDWSAGPARCETAPAGEGEIEEEFRKLVIKAPGMPSIVVKAEDRNTGFGVS